MLTNSSGSSDPQGVPTYHCDGLHFSVYSPEDIKALSVKEIQNPQTFDGLNHPSFGGLYDPALGPQEQEDVCTTCGLSSSHCPGHMGHIVLPLPVYQPLLFDSLFKLLRGTCFNCCRIRIMPATSALLKGQMALLKFGEISEAENLKDMHDGLTREIKTMEEGQIVGQQLRTHSGDIIQKLKAQGVDTSATGVRHVTEARQKLVKSFLGGQWFTNNCPYCKVKKRTMRTENNTKIFFANQTISMSHKATLEKRKRDEAKRKRLSELQERADYEGVLEEAEGEGDEDEVTKDKDKNKDKVLHQYLTPMQVKSHLSQVWKNDNRLLKSMLGMFSNKAECGTDSFFLDVLPVLPSRFRPLQKLGGGSFLLEHEQTYHLSKTLLTTWTVKHIMVQLRDQDKDADDLSTQTSSQDDRDKAERSPLKEKLQSAWLRLQAHINCIYDGNSDKLEKLADKKRGVKQLLERKQGLFRMHMMGKRVNYAARSVISPDPYIATNEIGVPDVFAMKLTYPQPVTPWNFHELKQAVINGPKVHPGALYVKNEEGTLKRLEGTTPEEREALAKQLLTPHTDPLNAGKTKTVYRHLKNGDIMLLNRQPTLHKASIQAHKARILPGQKTLRLHYANCKAYNADFDGDEMNAHLPQNEIGRAEANTLMLTDYNYLVAKDGQPLAGLIQDHMVSGVQLMIRGRHFTRNDYQQLVYCSLVDLNRKIRLVPPCIRKPQVLWSGKQVLSTLFLNVIPENSALLNLEGSAKVPDKTWKNRKERPWLAGGSPLVGNDMSESEVVIHQGELLVGILDKGHCGNAAYGLVHSCYELYGGPVAGQLLTGLARLFTKFLQWHGFTLGVEDILVTRKGDRKRRKVLEKGSLLGDAAAAKALNLPENSSKPQITSRYQEAHFSLDDGDMKDLDLQMKSNTDNIQNDVSNCIMPDCLTKKFPHNNLQLMVQSGAKGSNVNCLQISCLLGQIELEGRRPPLMMSGQYLPAFLPYDTSPRAGGFVAGRFLTGIRPQEYFFHCMAGREGLIDTAVKTSRSGYLQRCIIKHLEGLVVRYDTTVRESDGSIVQFQYGEDSLDIEKNQFMNEKMFPFLVSNQQVIQSLDNIQQIKDKLRYSKPLSLPERFKCEPKKVTKVMKLLRKRYTKWKKNHETDTNIRLSPFLDWCNKHYDNVLTSSSERSRDKNGRTPAANEACHRWINSKNSSERRKIEDKLEFIKHQPDPFQSYLLPSRHFSSTSERFEDILDKYIKNDPDKLFSSEDGRVPQIEPDRFRDLLYEKYLKSLVQPGHAVGLLAAQSIGEPSTQMTLNTFHFAGRGEMNVTLGIPRLREILMVATKHLKTPSMDIPTLNTPYAHKYAKRLQQKLTKVMLSQVLEDIQVTEYISISRDEKHRMYKIRFAFLPYKTYKQEYYLTPSRILAYVEKKFFTRLGVAIQKTMLEMKKHTMLHSRRTNRSNKEYVDPETEDAVAPPPQDGADDIVDDDLNDNDVASAKLREKQQEERDYDGEDEDREVVEEASDVEAEVEELGDDGESSSAESSTDDEGDMPKSDRLAKLKAHKSTKKVIDPTRIKMAINKMHMGCDYTYDPETETSCEVTLRFPLTNKKLDMLSLVAAEARQGVVTQVPGINRGFLTESKKPGEEGLLRMKTDGINITEMYNYQDILDMNQIYSNDIHAIARTYGIEAAARVIIKEVRDVFAAYGITVDYRHLSLVADYMTFEGVYKPFNRTGMESNASPLQKMTFETSTNFLKTATVLGSADKLKSPSSRIVVGRLVDGGTGVFDLIQPL